MNLDAHTPSADETTCSLVSSRGILKSCDIRSPEPESSWDCIDWLGPINDGSTVYVCGASIKRFVNSQKSREAGKYVLVSGDSDESCPDEMLSEEALDRFLNRENLLHWFAQNCTLSHAKVTRLPIGLDYHTLAEGDHWSGPKQTPFEQEQRLLEIASNAKPITERALKCFSNFQFTQDRWGDRRAAAELVPRKLIVAPPQRTNRDLTWQLQSQCAFVISPHGVGLDCHRTWEALVLGCIPIVKTSGLDPLFTNLPVLIVEAWSDISKGALELALSRHNTKQVLKELRLDHWTDLLRSKIRH